VPWRFSPEAAPAPAAPRAKKPAAKPAAKPASKPVAVKPVAVKPVEEKPAAKPAKVKPVAAAVVEKTPAPAKAEGPVTKPKKAAKPVAADVSPKAEAAKAEAPKAETPKSAPKKAAPKVAAAKAPAPVRNDDLTMIKGIGPKMADRLKAAGITSFAQIAGWDKAAVEKMDEDLGGLPGAIERANWVGQAKALV